MRRKEEASFVTKAPKDEQEEKSNVVYKLTKEDIKEIRDRKEEILSQSDRCPAMPEWQIRFHSI